MRNSFLCVTCFVALLLPGTGAAQVYHLPAPPPEVTAARAVWQLNGTPLFYAGAFYYPTGPTVFFDGFVMVRTGMYEGIPLYSDTTLEPYSIVYVPIGGNVMRPYERKRSGELAGTVGSRTPSFPIERDVEVSVSARTAGLTFPPLADVSEPTVVPEAARTPAPTAIVAPPATSGMPKMSRARSNAAPFPRAAYNRGIWIEYNGTRWHTAGGAVSYSPQLFRAIGEYKGFPVYRAIRGDRNRIYIPVVANGGLTPYTKS